MSQLDRQLKISLECGGKAPEAGTINQVPAWAERSGQEADFSVSPVGRDLEEDHEIC